MSIAFLVPQSRRAAAGVAAAIQSGSTSLFRYTSTFTQSTPSSENGPSLSSPIIPNHISSSTTPPLGMRLSFPFAPGLDKETVSTLESMPIPRNVMSLYMKPLRRPAPHGIPVCNLQLRSYSVRNLEFFADFAMRAAYYLGLPAKGPVPLPRITERWTIPRSPFIFKKSQENFERVTVRRLIQIQDGNLETVQAWLAYLEKRGFHGIGMKADVWDQEDLGVLERMDKLGAEVEKVRGEEVRKLVLNARQRARSRPGAMLKAARLKEEELNQDGDLNAAVMKEVERIVSEIEAGAASPDATGGRQ